MFLELVASFVCGCVFVLTALFFLLFHTGSGFTAEERQKEGVVEVMEIEKENVESDLSLRDYHILSRLDYDLGNRNESAQWMNVLMAQLIDFYRNDSDLLKDGMESIGKVLNSAKPSYLNEIHILRLSLGKSYPVIRGVEIKQVGNNPRIRAEISFEFRDKIEIQVETQIVLNIPQTLAALPIELTIGLEELSGIMAIEFDPFECCLAVSLLKECELKLKVGSSIGHVTKVRDVEKVKELIIEKLRRVFREDFVEPKCKKIVLPHRDWMRK